MFALLVPVVFGQSSPVPSAAVPVIGPFRLLRYDEDYRAIAFDRLPPSLWRSLKHIPIGDSIGGPFVSIGGEVRFQYIARWDDQFGRVPGAQDSLQQRYLLHGDFEFTSRLRIFAQLLSAWEHGRKPAPLPPDVDHLDAQQLFVETSLDDSASRNNYLRIGRQEILFGGHQLLKVREGPNVRLAFDAVRAHVNAGAFDADAFVATVVQPRPGSFDNRWIDRKFAFSGANFAWQRSPAATRAEFFFFDYQNNLVRYEQAAGREHRRTVGLRLSGRRGPWEFDYDVSDQFGTLGSLDIHAWGAALFNSYRWDHLALKPKITLGVSYVTGDRDRTDGQLNTFNCLFARGDYFGDTSLLTGSNTLDIGLIGECSPTPRLKTTTQWDQLWRSETSDGLYAPPLVYIVNGRASGARFIGHQLTQTLTYAVNRSWTIQVIGAILLAGDFLRASTPGKNTRALTMRTQFKF